VYRDDGVQGFRFADADGANAFLVAARRSLRGAKRDPEGVVTFVLDRMIGSPRVAGYEKPLRFRVEHTHVVDEGVVVSGWLAHAAASVGRCRAWSLETGTFVDLTRVWRRSPRPDIRERFSTELADAPDDLFGFEASLGSSTRGGFFLGFVAKGQREEWIEIERDSAERGST
jgi:hypothetical protein